jgi:hypothetical protein
MWPTPAIKKTAQSKQSPIGRKFAQSGHRENSPNLVTLTADRVEALSEKKLCWLKETLR